MSDYSVLQGLSERMGRAMFDYRRRSFAQFLGVPFVPATDDEWAAYNSPEARAEREKNRIAEPEPDCCPECGMPWEDE